MKNRILLVFLAMVLVVSLAAFAACATTEDEPPPLEENGSPPLEEEWQWPETVIVGCSGHVSPSYGAGVAWTTPMAEDLGIRIRVVSQENHMLRTQWFKSGRLFMGGQTKGGKENMEGAGAFAARESGPYMMSAMWAMGITGMAFAVAPELNIKTPYDIKPGTRLIYMAWIPHGKPTMDALLAWGQIDPESVIWVPSGSTSAMARLFMDGKGDIMFAWAVESSLFYEAEVSPRGIAWIDLDVANNPEAAERYLEVKPESSFGVIQNGCPSVRGTLGLSSIPSYLCRIDEDPELVYRIVKWLDENYDVYKINHSWCEYQTLANTLKISETEWQPIHPGTVRYLEEKGLWTPAHEARRQQNIDLMQKWVDAYDACIAFADETGIDVTPENEEWMDLWASYKKDLTPFSHFRQGLEG